MTTELRHRGVKKRHFFCSTNLSSSVNVFFSDMICVILLRLFLYLFGLYHCIHIAIDFIIFIASCNMLVSFGPYFLFPCHFTCVWRWFCFFLREQFELCTLFKESFRFTWHNSKNPKTLYVVGQLLYSALLR